MARFRQAHRQLRPGHRERIGSYADATQADAEAAIQAAVKAFQKTDWKKHRRLRAKVLNQMPKRFEARRATPGQPPGLCGAVVSERISDAAV